VVDNEANKKMRIVEAVAAPCTVRLSQAWPDHSASRMARDFLLWRHLRVVRARVMRHFHLLAQRLAPIGAAPPARSVYGVEMEANWADRTFAYCQYGTYGPYLADLLASIDQPFCFLDIGANQGLFSLIAAKNPLCEKIVALEPVPATHRLLATNLARAGLGGRAEALNVGLSDTAGSHAITINPVHSGQASLEAHMAERNDCESIAIELVTMSELEAHLPVHLPLFVKIDVEGHEPVIIEELLASRHASRVLGIFYEHDNRWTDNATIARALYRAGFAKLKRYGRGKHYDVLAGPSPVPLDRVPAFENGIAEVRRQHA
jgi:FkbM family methyltransferase